MFPDTPPEPKTPQAYVAEFVGTFFLVFFIVVILAVNSTEGLGFQIPDFSVVGLVHFFVLAMAITTLGGVSGGHFNPAVTAVMALLRRITPTDAAIYTLVQLSGGVAAALLAKALLDDEGDVVNYGATLVNEDGFLDGKAFSGMIIEALGTFALVWAIFGTAVNPRGDARLAPIIIAGTLALAVMCFGPMTGAGFNPARSFGPALVSGEFGGAGDFILTYVIGPVVGAVLAGVLYSYIALQPPPTKTPATGMAGTAGTGARADLEKD